VVHVQTFLPYPDFAATAAALDRQRLGKQRVETLQIMKALRIGTKGWVNHPATKMWRGHEAVLLNYQRAIVHEWTVVRGYKDTCWEKTVTIWHVTFGPNLPHAHELPDWLGDDDFHLAHQSNLIRKDPEFYRQVFGDDIPDDLPYIWPA
jgi:hypothetical protein